MTLNTHYKIPEITFNSLCAAIEKLGFDAAFDIALTRAISEIRRDRNSIVISESLSWSHNLRKRAVCCEDEDLKARYMDVAAFCRKLAHHVYWAAREDELVEHNPNFIQAVR